MRNAGRPTPLGAILLFILVAVLLFAGIFWVSQKIFGGGNSGSDSAKTEDKTDPAQELLLKPSAKTWVSLSVRGPITAREVHYSINLTISQDSREITTFRGYNGDVIAEKKLANTPAAFAQFTAALERAGFYQKIANVGDDTEGICAVGQLIFFEIGEGDKTVRKTWTTECGSPLAGNFGGLMNNVVALFKAQIPGSEELISQAKQLTANAGQENYDPGVGNTDLLKNQ